MPRAKPSTPGRKRGAISQLARVYVLVESLREGKVIRTVDAAERFKVSRRQVQRDLKAIGDTLGLPLVEVEGEEGAWRFDREASRRRSVRVERAALLALTVGERLSEPLWSDETRRALLRELDRLEATLTGAASARRKGWSRRVAVVSPGAKDYADRPELARVLDVVLDAMLSNRALGVTYLSHPRAREGHAPRALRVNPLGLVHYRDGVYFIVDVVGCDARSAGLAGKRILLALDRIRAVERTEDSFTLPRGFDARDFLGDAFGIMRREQDATLDVVIEVSAHHAPWLSERRVHASQSTERRADGSLVVRLRVRGVDEVGDWVISLGEHAEVVSPPELRDHVARRLKKAAAQYGRGGDILRRRARDGDARAGYLNPRPGARERGRTR